MKSFCDRTCRDQWALLMVWTLPPFSLGYATQDVVRLKKMKHQNPFENAMNLLKLKFRNQVFRSFQDWYGANQKNFSRKISVVTHKRNSLELAVEGIPKEVMSIFIRSLINIEKSPYLETAAYFYLAGECFDSAGWFDASPIRVAGGYRCAICDEEGKNSTIYSSRKALWDQHVFTPLMTWINRALGQVERIDFCQTKDGGSSWVKLVTDESIMEERQDIASFRLLPKNQNEANLMA